VVIEDFVLVQGMERFRILEGKDDRDGMLGFGRSGAFLVWECAHSRCLQWAPQAQDFCHYREREKRGDFIKASLEP
jgi:hypothetical protein